MYFKAYSLQIVADPDVALHFDADPDPTFTFWCESVSYLTKIESIFVLGSEGKAGR